MMNLKSCPFCNNAPQSRAVPADDHVGPDWWQIACGDCEVKIERPDKAMALRDWDRRFNDWQSIESAPREQRILGLVAGVPEWVYGASEGWTFDDTGESCDPTHWMPLPEPPEKQ